MNQPYVKKYNDNGVLTNPIKGAYRSPFENREQRRRKKPKLNNRKVKNSKGTIVRLRNHFRHVLASLN